MRRLNKALVEEILASRFAGGFLRLRDLPTPESLKDMQKAARRIAQAIKRGERIAVVGDYDVDGVISSVIMREFFDATGYKKIEVVIPNRFRDGYGLSPDIVRRLEADLIVTVDNGIAAFEAARYCKEAGCDLIITDHHTPPPELPDAYAIVNPKQETCDFAYKEICGAQVAWFLAGAIKAQLGANVDMKRFLDILGIAIVADVMPLRHINRTLLQAGLLAFERSDRPAVAVLREMLKKSRLESDDIAFGVAPLLNSAGRMEDARLAYDFLLASDATAAARLLDRLSALNEERKRSEKEVFAAAAKQVGDERVIVACGEGWNEGVVGIVAARLAQRFGRPAVVLTKAAEGHLKGSGRSVGSVDLYGLLYGAKDLLKGFGGHKKAAGLSLEPANLEPLRRRLDALASTLPKEDFIADDEVLGELPLREVDWELMEILERFAPYGESNPMPKFAAFGVEVRRWRRVGRDGEHLLLDLRHEGRTFRAIKFRESADPAKTIDIAYYPSKNVFNNEVSIQLYLTKMS